MTSHDGSPENWTTLATEIVDRLATRHAELTCVCDELSVKISEGEAGDADIACVLNGTLRLSPQRSATNPTMTVSGKLDGALGGAPLTIDGDGRTLVVKTGVKTLRTARRSRQALEPLFQSLAIAGIDVKLKLGVLPAVRVK